MKRILICLILIALLSAGQVFAARNVILIVPDGCSVPIWQAIRAMTVGVDGSLNLDRMPLMGRCRTYAANGMVTDSAAAGTALATGHKTNVGLIGMDARTARGDSLSGSPLRSLLEIVRDEGYATGLVTTTMINHATPAAYYAHRADRDWYELIANDLVTSDVDVIMGGGRSYFIPSGSQDNEGAPSKRTDSRDLIAEMKAQGYTYAPDRAAFDAVDPESVDKLLCLFNPGHMEYEYDRNKDIAGEPGIWDMMAKSLDILSKNKKGFFLLVEAGRIDHAGHDHDTTRFLWDGIACDKAVGVAMEFATENKNTLVFVVPDHGTGGPYVAGVEAPDGTIESYDKGGFVSYSLDSNGFPVNDRGRPIALRWVDWGGHTAEDVAWFAMGVDQKDFGGLINNTDVFDLMIHHFRLKADKRDISDIIDY